MSATRVKYDALKSNEYGAEFRYQGVPFTGTAYIEVDGELRDEVDFAEGVHHGWSRSWNAGQLVIERPLHWDLAHGVARYWHPNGKLWREWLCELGISLHLREYDRDGNLTTDFRADPVDIDDELDELRAIFDDAPAVARSLDE